MKKLILTAMLLLAVSLCSCYAPNHSTDTPTRADLDLPLSDVTEPYAPPASEKWQYDPDPYDDVKIYGGMIGGGTAFVTVKDDLCTLTVEISETVSSVVNFDLKTTYTVTGLSLIRPQNAEKGEYSLYAETYTVTASRKPSSDSAVLINNPTKTVSDGQLFSAAVTLDDENGLCTVHSITADDKNEGRISTEYEYVRGSAHKTFVTTDNLKAELQYSIKTGRIMVKTVNTYNDEGTRTHALYKTWYNSGILKSVQEASDGGAYDYAVYYHENGNIKSETRFEQSGSLSEISTHYNEDGVLTSKKYYDGDYLHEISYYDDGETVYSEQIDVIDTDYINSLYTLSIKYWYRSGALLSEKVNVKNGKSHFKSYFEDGRLKREVRYTKTGGTEYEIAYYEDGTLQCEIDNVNKTNYVHEIIPYPDGRPDRIRITVNDVTTTTDYYPNGIKKYEYICSYVFDMGDFTKEWYENGVLKCEDNWDPDSLQGKIAAISGGSAPG